MAQDMTIKTASAALLMPAEKNIYERYSDAVNANRIVGELLKYSKGEWLAGRDADEVPMGTQFVAGIDKLQVGWIRWWDNKPSETLMGYLSDNFVPPRRQDLGDVDTLEWQRDEATGLPRDPWQPSSSVVMMSLKGGRIYTMAASSKGSISVLGKLAGSYGTHMRMKPDELPIVALGTDSYKHSNKAFGKIHIPVLGLAGWVSRSQFDERLRREVDALTEGEGGDEGEGEPAARDYAAVKGKRESMAKAGAKPAAKRGKGAEAPYAGEGTDAPF